MLLSAATPSPRPARPATPCRRLRRRETRAGRSHCPGSPVLTGSAATTAWLVHVASRLIGTRLTAFRRVTERERASRGWRIAVEKRHLVVSCRTAVRAQRRFGTLAAHTRDTAHQRCAATLTASGGLGTARDLGIHRRRSVAPRRIRWCRGLRLTRLLLSPHRYKDPLAILRHGVLVFLSKETPLNQNVDAGRKRVGILRVPSSEESDGARVLLTAEDQLGFLFAARLLSPHGHCHGHQYQHDRQHDQQGGHRITLFLPHSRLTM